jgi:hypothetical protein
VLTVTVTGAAPRGSGGRGGPASRRRPRRAPG